MRVGYVYVNGVFAGTIKEDSGYHFLYSAEYLNSEGTKPVSLTMPLAEKEYYSPTMFPFFDGLIPEGRLLKVAIDNWKLDPRDRMGLLLSSCFHPIGNVSVSSKMEDEP